MDLKPTFIAACLFAFGTAAFAEDAHHPADAKQPPAALPAQPSGKAMGGMGPMHEHMKLMHEQMVQIRAATDPKEKQRLIEEHMKTMEQSMSTMQGMMGMMHGEQQ